jgi:RNA polymerase sigma-70 factor, ECF subfamily
MRLKDGSSVTDDDDHKRFAQVALPHLDAAFNLARWLTRSDHDASDVVQEAYLRAMRHFAGFRGDQGRPWLLKIVRNTCFSWLRENRPAELTAIDDEDHSRIEGAAPEADEPPNVAQRHADREQINRAIAALPAAFREVLVLRELEDLSYREIARIADIPLGTVMSRLARARGLLQLALRPGARPLLRTVPPAARDGAK